MSRIRTNSARNRKSGTPHSAVAGRVLFVVAAFTLSSAQTPGIEERLAKSRNLGKAFYENPTTQTQAVAEFRKALILAPDSLREKLNYALALLRAGRNDEAVPILKEVQKRDGSLPHTWFNLGIYYKKSGDLTNAIAQFERMIELAPREAISHYQLATLYKLVGRAGDSLTQFEFASNLDPNLAAAHFQLYNIYRQGGRADDAAFQLAEFTKLKKLAESAAIPEDVDWCFYAEIYDPPVPVSSADGTAAPVWEEKVLPGKVDPKTGGLAVIDSTGSGQTDLLAWSSLGIALFRRGETNVADSGLAGIKDVVHVAPGDFDNDGLIDLCVLTGSGPSLYRNVKGRFVPVAADLPKRRFERAVWIDYDHDYDLDLILLGDTPSLMRNQGTAGFSDRTADFPFVKGSVVGASKLRAVPDTKAFDLAVAYLDRPAVLYRDQLGGRYDTTSYQGVPPDVTSINADLDGDGRPERVRIAPDGTIHVLTNRARARPHWIRIQLAGVRSPKLAEDAEVEIKAGSLYRKQTYTGVPIVFDLGAHAEIDTVRITWPNGLIQNEMRQAANKSYVYKESQRLSGSCPMIWTWDGKKFQFITDVLGVAPLGASDGEGTFFPVAHEEYIRIPSSALSTFKDHYEVRITEELSEVSYLDQVRLIAIDHPASSEIFTNDKFKSPPFPDFRLFGVTSRIYPKSARDSAGRDVLPLLLAQDFKYPARFARSESGVAELHALDLDFGPQAAPDGRTVLLLHGWVDWADGSTFRGAAQESKAGLIFPYLQMKDSNGHWKTVNEDMGMPSGKPKTIAVELTFPTPNREVRIVTNLCVYWDEIFLSNGATNPVVQQHLLPLTSADLQFRGFSESRIDPERKQPDTFFYDRVSPTSFWNPTPGLYTRYGDVRDLISDVDDRPVIMGSGDEVRLRFDSRGLPAVRSGWKRDFLLKVDGWAKDRDPNTAFSNSVEPLPFHKMTRYPYPASEHFPDDPAHERYRLEFNTRPALRLIRPLAERN